MAENKKSFILYCDLIHTVSKMPNEKAGELFKHILEYVNDMSPKTEDLITQLTFEPIKQQLKRDLKQWESKSAKRSEAGRIGGIKSGESRSKTKQNQAKPSKDLNNEANEAVTDTVTVIVNVTDTVNDNVLLKKETKNILFDFKKNLIDYGFENKLVDEWLLVRKKKKAVNTETAFKNFIKEVESSGRPPNEIIAKCVSKSWSGFESVWLENLEKEKKYTKKEKQGYVENILTVVEQAKKHFENESANNNTAN